MRCFFFSSLLRLLLPSPPPFFFKSEAKYFPCLALKRAHTKTDYTTEYPSGTQSWKEIFCSSQLSVTMKEGFKEIAHALKLMIMRWKFTVSDTPPPPHSTPTPISPTTKTSVFQWAYFKFCFQTSLTELLGQCNDLSLSLCTGT